MTEKGAQLEQKQGGGGGGRGRLAEERGVMGEVEMEEIN